MDSRITMVLAGALLLGAAAAGYWGLQLSGTPAQPQASTQASAGVSASQITSRIDQATDDAQRQSVVVAVRNLQPFVAVVAEDVQIEQLRIVPPGSFSSVEQVLGKTTWNPIAAGSWLSQESFVAGGPLAQMIRPNERALAVPVDEIVGGGGHLRPGDYVDVLLFMADDGSRNDSQTKTAQVAVPALRLLSIGEELGPTSDGKAAEVKDEDKDKKAQPKVPRSVVLAVPEQWVTRLMLASQAGTLRLAVRSADEHLQQRYLAGEAVVAPLNEQTRSLLPIEQLASQSAPRSVAPVPVRRATATAVSRPRVEIFRGVDNSWQTP